ncbi:MAG: pre-16S rRNA-processing nuclease YqgF [Bacillota bacterium]
MKNKPVLALDPGRDKTGLAVVSPGKVYLQAIVPTCELKEYLPGPVNRYNIDRIVLGGGTGSERVRTAVRNSLGERIVLCTVEEDYSTAEAEKRFFRDHPPSGWKRLLFFVSWRPPKPVDDYAAVVLAERFLQQEGDG